MLPDRTKSRRLDVQLLQRVAAGISATDAPPRHELCDHILPTDFECGLDSGRHT